MCFQMFKSFWLLFLDLGTEGIPVMRLSLVRKFKSQYHQTFLRRFWKKLTFFVFSVLVLFLNEFFFIERTLIVVVLVQSVTANINRMITITKFICSKSSNPLDLSQKNPRAKCQYFTEALAAS